MRRGACALLTLLVMGIIVCAGCQGASAREVEKRSPLIPASAATAQESARAPLSTATVEPDPTATRTLTQVPTRTPGPTRTPTKVVKISPSSTASGPPALVGESERRIVIDLSEQRLYAYDGNEVVLETLVSTGLPGKSTPRGTFHIWIKLEADDMAGPGYYLPAVPCTMYFHGGYGIHGTYWHSNFGQRMSHGCVNLPTEKACELFEWAEVGTPVIVQE